MSIMLSYVRHGYALQLLHIDPWGKEGGKEPKMLMNEVRSPGSSRLKSVSFDQFSNGYSLMTQLVS